MQVNIINNKTFSSKSNRLSIVNTKTCSIWDLESIYLKINFMDTKNLNILIYKYYKYTSL